MMVTQMTAQAQTSGQTGGPAAPVRVTPENCQELTKDLPFLVRKALKYAMSLHAGELTVNLPDGRSLLFKGEQPGPAAVLNVRDTDFARSLAKGGDIGIAEAYLRGQWDTPDLTRFLELFCVNHGAVQTLLEGRPLTRIFQMIRHYLRRNTRSGSRRNIHAHYDLGNRFYEAWLDPTMTYSAAIFAPGDNELSSAQTRKYRQLAERTQIGPEHHVLEIGCGWGGFAEFAAAEIGCRVTGLTISREQHDYAVRRMAERGLSDKVEIKLLDYRDERGLYDRIVSIEMFEAVGEEYWETYFAQLRDRLKDGGRAGVQVITIQDGLFPNYRRELDFIRHYIFPGGMLPSPSILKGLGEKAGLPLAHEKIFGLDYAETLKVWRDRFRAAWPNLTPLGFDERFRRMWEYYLAYCEAGFRSGNIDVRQMVFAKA